MEGQQKQYINCPPLYGCGAEDIMRQILIKDSMFFIQAAVLEAGRLEDFIFEDKGSESFLGNIYKGRVENIVKGMEAAFINVGLKKNAYLHKSDLLSNKFLREKNIKKSEAGSIARVLKTGDELMVQINRDPIGEKDVSVTTDISIPGKLLALLPQDPQVNISYKIKSREEKQRLLQIGESIMTDSNGMVLRTYAEHKDKEEIEKEYRELSSIYNKIQREYNYSYAPKLLKKSNSIIERIFKDYVDSDIKEIYVENTEIKNELTELIKAHGLQEAPSIKITEKSHNIFEEFNIEKQVSMLFERRVELENGGSIFIDVTEAMTVIDVNSGRYTGGKNFDETALDINMSALEEIARQIRLRNISGIIIIDLIDIKNQNYTDKIVEKAKSVFKKDRARIEVLGMTRLNLMELTRKKNKENFFNLMNEDCPYCGGSGRVLSPVQIILKTENIIKKVKENTSCNSIVLSVGSVMYMKVMKSCMDKINEMADSCHVTISFEEDRSIETEDIIIKKMQ